MFWIIYILCLHLCIWNHLNMNIQVCIYIYIIYTVYIVSGKGRWPFLGTPILFIGSIHLSWDMRLWKDLSMIVLGVVQPSAWSVIAMNLDVFCHIFFSKAGFCYIDYSKFLRDPRSLSHVHVSKKEFPVHHVPLVIMNHQQYYWVGIIQESYNTPLEHTPGNPPTQLWKDSLYNLLVKL